MATKVGVFHGRGDAAAPETDPVKGRAGQRHLASAPPYYYILSATPQGRTEVKLNRVFLPRRFCHARSRGCGFTRT